MRSTKKLIASALAACMLASSSVVTGFAAVAPDEGVAAANPWVEAAQALDSEYTYDGELGAIYSPQQTVFRLWAPTATSVTLNRYATGSDDETGAADLGTVAMEKLMDGDKWTGVWTATVQGDIVNTYYTYSVEATQMVTGKTQKAETQDVYSVATGVNGKRSMVCDLDSTDPEGWDNDAHVVPERQTDSQVWEIHIKDFSYDASSGVSENNRGKYLAFTENGTTVNNEGELSTCIDYLKNLGITTVQINPFYDFQSINEAGDDEQFNWGYDPQNYNVPEGSYSSNPYDGNVRINECKQMIKALHDAGFSVVMDVVYNHTMSCDKDDSCFQASVPNYYHRMDKSGNFGNGSGCGNEVSSEYAMTRKYIVESCLYWVNEYHVDGFRFDLMGLIDTETMNIIREEMDKIDTRLTIWGEGWTGGTSVHASKTCTGAKFYPATQANAAKLDSRVAFFNDKIRDGIKGSVFDMTEKGFIAGNAEYFKNVLGGVTANSSAKNGWLALAPEQTVSYAACHDNATLYDQITASATYGQYGVRNDLGVKLSKMASAILNTSQGATFYLAGDEIARTKFGDTNSYKSSPEINKIRWDNLKYYADLYSYYQGMIKIKKCFTPLLAADKSYAEAFNFFGKGLTDMGNSLTYVITNDQEGEWKKMAVVHNGGARSVKVTLGDDSVSSWTVIANGEAAGLDALDVIEGNEFSVPANTSLVAVDSESFNSCAFEDGRGSVRVNYISRRGVKVADSVIIKGALGTAFNTVPSSSVESIYSLYKVDGNTSGVFSAETQEVNYVYEDYVPESIELNGDVNGDGFTNISDCTDLQKLIAAKTVIDSRFDFDYDGSVTINDVTMLQKHLAYMNVASSAVEVNYFYNDPKTGEQKNLTPSILLKGRVGDDFTTSIYKVMGYTVDETRLPEVTQGKFPYGDTLVVNYYYVAGSLDVKLHIKHSGNKTWDPYLWIWGSDLDGKDKGNYTGGDWNGKPAAELNPDTGWYEYGFTYSGAGTYNVIVAGSEGQSKDYKGFVENEMWVIIDDDNISSGKFLSFYTENPEENPNAPEASFFIGN